MPYFPDRNALFVHIPKNAGRSIEAMLLPPPLTPDSGRRPVLNRIAHLLQTLTADRTPARFLLGSLDVVVASQHLTYQEIRLLGLLPASTLASAYSFCVVRNPYDRILSTLKHFARRFQAHYSLGTPSEIARAIDFWLDLEPADHNLRAHRRPQSDYVITPRGEIAVTDVLRFETLAQDIDRVRDRLGLSGSALPWVGQGRETTGEGAYRLALTPEARKAVARAFEPDLEMFKYVF